MGFEAEVGGQMAMGLILGILLGKVADTDGLIEAAVKEVQVLAASKEMATELAQKNLKLAGAFLFICRAGADLPQQLFQLTFGEALPAAANQGQNVADDVGIQFHFEAIDHLCEEGVNAFLTWCYKNDLIPANPMQKLVVPRVLATVIATPLLAVMANVIGVLGGMLITIREAGVTPRFYIDQVRNSLLMEDFLSGVTKAAFFGFFIAIISCYQGLNTIGGTEGVGRATTRAVVISATTIFVSDFFLTKIFLYF